MKRILVMILVIGLTLTYGCARKSTAQDSDYNNHVENSPIEIKSDQLCYVNKFFSRSSMGIVSSILPHCKRRP